MRDSERPDGPPRELPPHRAEAAGRDDGGGSPRSSAALSPDEKRAALVAALAAVQPRAVLLPSWRMRRVIQGDRQLGLVTWAVPHRKSYLLRRARLVELECAPTDRGAPNCGSTKSRAAAAPLPNDSAETPETAACGAVRDLPAGGPRDWMYLLSEPTPSRLASQSLGDLLRTYWRRLFHLEVHRVWADRAESAPLSAADLRRRWDALGRPAVEEIRTVLTDDRFLFPGADDRAVYEEFAAVYLELRQFAPNLLKNYFPSLADRWVEVDRLLAEDVPAAESAERSRPRGATLDGEPPFEGDAWHGDPAADEGSDEWSGEAYVPQAARYLAWAEAARRKGNLIRAARLETYVRKRFGGEVGERAKAGAWKLIEELVQRLAVPLRIPPAERRRWTCYLFELLEFATPLRWTTEARLLYDLQSIALDHQREFYSVDLVEWVLWKFKRPLKRFLPDQPLLQIGLHLRHAIDRLPALRVENSVRRGLRELLQRANEHVEQRVRDHFRPKVVQTLLDGGLRPANAAERVAHAEVADIICDHIAHLGYFNFGHVRDAISANQIKLGDLDRTAQAFTGDELLRLDRLFAERLDGVYRRAEAYIRWQQTFSAIAFGTPAGRFLSLNAAIPFGGSFIALRGLAYLGHEIEHLFFSEPEPPGTPYEVAKAHAEEHLKQWEAFFAGVPQIFLLGLLILGLIHSRTVRWGAKQALWWTYRSLRGVVYDLPAYALDNPWLRALWKTNVGVVLARHLLLPAATATATWPLWRFVFVRPPDRWTAIGCLAVLLSLALLTRPGRDAFEVGWDRFVKNWFRFWMETLPNFFRSIMSFFKLFVERTERALYAVDESFRFKTTDSDGWRYVKSVFGAVWFYIHYVVRFCVVLLIEPQINPIKHFPVVTVSHKVILPLAFPLGTALFHLGYAENVAAGQLMAGIFLSGIPGIFGYLAWELKENWKLYAANRPERLLPTIVGSHGENVRRLLLPGFHSGTIPKIYARMRSADRQALRSGDWRYSRLQREGLHHVEHEIRLLFEREFTALLALGRRFRDTPPEVGHIRIGTNGFAVEIRCPARGPEPFTAELFVIERTVVARIPAPGFLDGCDAERRAVFETAWGGLLTLCGVQYSRERIAHRTGTAPAAVDFEGTGPLLRLATADGTESAWSYLWPTQADTLPVRRWGPAGASPPPLHGDDVLLTARPIPWSDWVDYWEREGTADAPLPPTLPAVADLLPPAESAAMPSPAESAPPQADSVAKPLPHAT